MGQKSLVADRPRSDVALQVADEVRAWLARRRLSANRAAQSLGWSQPYIAQRLNGRQAFDLDDLAQLSDLLSVPVRAFFATPDQTSGGQLINVHYQTNLRMTSHNGYRPRHVHATRLDEHRISQKRTSGTFQPIAA